MTAEEFYNTERPDNNDDYQLTKDTEYWYFGKDEMIEFAEAYHKQEVEAISDERPNIKETLGDISLMEAHEEYQKSPLLFMHIQLLDNYIDKLLNK